MAEYEIIMMITLTFLVAAFIYSYTACVFNAGRVSAFKEALEAHRRIKEALEALQWSAQLKKRDGK